MIIIRDIKIKIIILLCTSTVYKIWLDTGIISIIYQFISSNLFQSSIEGAPTAAPTVIQNISTVFH